MQKFCEACGMPMEKAADFAGGDINAKFCVYCVGEDGVVKSCEEIFEGGVQFFMNQLGSERTLAEKVTRKNMKMQPYWQDKNCEILQGEEVSDEEFAEILKNLA